MAKQIVFLVESCANCNKKTCRHIEELYPDRLKGVSGVKCTACGYIALDPKGFKRILKAEKEGWTFRDGDLLPPLK